MIPTSLNQSILKLAAPLILSNLAVPLLGVFNMALMGHQPSHEALAALGLGVMVFDLLFLSLNFLRMSTTGLIAQASGSQEDVQRLTILLRSGSLALLLGILLIACNPMLISLISHTSGLSAKTLALVESYVSIRLYAAPATLMIFVQVGFLIGDQRARFAMILALFDTLAGMGVSALAVLIFGLGLKGLAVANVLSQYSTFILGCRLIVKQFPHRPILAFSWRSCFAVSSLRSTIAMNTNLFIRTLCLTGSLSLFTLMSARLGSLILATNTLLMSIQGVTSYFLDGFANATEALVGSALHSSETARLQRVLKATLVWSGGSAALLTFIYALCGPWLIPALSSIPEVQISAKQYWPFFVAFPIISSFSFWLDGVFVGLLQTRSMRNTMIAAMIGFVLTSWLLFAWGNTGLLSALACFYGFRALFLSGSLRSFLKSNQFGI